MRSLVRLALVLAILFLLPRPNANAMEDLGVSDSLLLPTPAGGYGLGVRVEPFFEMPVHQFTLGSERSIRVDSDGTSSWDPAQSSKYSPAAIGIAGVRFGWRGLSTSYAKSLSAEDAVYGSTRFEYWQASFALMNWAIEGYRQRYQGFHTDVGPEQNGETRYPESRSRFIRRRDDIRTLNIGASVHRGFPVFGDGESFAANFGALAGVPQNVSLDLIGGGFLHRTKVEGDAALVPYEKRDGFDAQTVGLTGVFLDSIGVSGGASLLYPWERNYLNFLLMLGVGAESKNSSYGAINRSTFGGVVQAAYKMKFARVGESFDWGVSMHVDSVQSSVDEFIFNSIHFTTSVNLAMKL